MIELSIILAVRDQEPMVAPLVACAETIGTASPVSFEILALDESSGDNTLSVLSVLHSRTPQLRTLQDLDVGRGLARGSRVARGVVWLILDHPVDPGLATWAVAQVRSGQHAAIVPGELLAVTRTLGTDALRTVLGGLMAAQDAVERMVHTQGLPIARSPSPRKSLPHRVERALRQRLSRVGLVGLDRPWLR